MRNLTVLGIVGVFLALGACKTDAIRSEVSAQVIDPTPESHAELQHVVSSALGGRSVTIAENALTKESMLIIGPRNLTGRDLGKPEQFRLVLSGSTCILVHLGSNSRSELAKTNCVAE